MSTELQKMNGQQTLAIWAERIAECRSSGLSVKTWCKQNQICEQTYYRWQKRVFTLAKAQHEAQFAEVTPILPAQNNSPVAITVHVAGISADIHNGADPATVEAVLRILKLC